MWLLFTKQHQSNDDYLEDKMEHFHNCFVACCVLPLCTVTGTHTHEQFLQLTVGIGLSLAFYYMFFVLCFN